MNLPDQHWMAIAAHLTNSPSPPLDHGSYVRQNRTRSEMGG
jgi:hypothetical protein